MQFIFLLILPIFPVSGLVVFLCSPSLAVAQSSSVRQAPVLIAVVSLLGVRGKPDSNHQPHRTPVFLFSVGGLIFAGVGHSVAVVEVSCPIGRGRTVMWLLAFWAVICRDH